MLFPLILACAPAEAPQRPQPVAVSQPSYDETRAALEVQRLALAADPQRIPKARAVLLDSVRDELIPYWLGTPWDFYGATTTPNKGHIACGYFVSTVLEHAGLQVERVFMAQQASEYIVKTFSDEKQLQRFRNAPAETVVDWVANNDDGIYVVGLDFHVGFLVKRGKSVEFCHSAYTGVTAVDCADPVTDPGFASNYRIVGPVLTDKVVQAWLDGAALPTFQRQP